MNITTKIGAAVSVLLALGVVVGVRVVARQNDHRAHSLEEKTSKLPALQIGEVDVQAADRVSIALPGKDGGAATEVVLAKNGDAWVLEKPMSYPADGKRVDSLLSNLAKLKVTEKVSASAEAYVNHGLADDKARHVVVSNAGSPIVDVYVGDGGSRGTMTRVAGHDGVFAVSGYSKQAVELDANGWRDKGVLKFDPAKAVSATLKSEEGVFEFKKEGDSWTGRWGPQRANRSIPDFDPAKVATLLNAFKALNAVGFDDQATEGKPAETGLDKPSASFTVELEGGATETLLLGSTSTGTNRWGKTPRAPKYLISRPLQRSGRPPTSRNSPHRTRSSARSKPVSWAGTPRASVLNGRRCVPPTSG